MKEVTEFFKGLFATNLWPARWHCGTWTDFHGWLYILSDLTIWLSYFLIPVIIIDYFIKKRAVLKFQRIYFLFAAFILLCGTTHFLDALMFWVPMYRLNGLVRLFTAIVSAATVYYLVKLLPEAFKQKTNTELELEISRRKIAEQKLSAAVEGLQAFAFMASHDLQEPLRKIRTYGTMLQKANAETFDDKSREYTEKVVGSASKMQQLIEDVLELSSIEESMPLHRVSLGNVIQNALEDLEIKIQEKQAIIEVGALPEVMGNERYLQQVFSNLISNSIKFSKQVPLIKISGRKKGSRVVIECTDNGVGMKPEETEKIFSAFTRLHSKSQYEGTGLGLAISKKIIALHGGDISALSSENGGATFIIELPAAN